MLAFLPRTFSAVVRKTQTWSQARFDEPSSECVSSLINNFYDPFHESLSSASRDCRDCWRARAFLMFIDLLEPSSPANILESQIHNSFSFHCSFAFTNASDCFSHRKKNTTGKLCDLKIVRSAVRNKKKAVIGNVAKSSFVSHKQTRSY